MYKPNRTQATITIELNMDIPLRAKYKLSEYISEQLKEIVKEIDKNKKDFGTISHEYYDENVFINGDWSCNIEDYQK